MGRREEGRDVGADGIERDIPEVEQTREPDHDVQADGHDREDHHERDGRVVRQRQREDVPRELGQELAGRGPDR